MDTLAAAIKAGATHLVIGCPITQASDPVRPLRPSPKRSPRR